MIPPSSGTGWSARVSSWGAYGLTLPDAPAEGLASAPSHWPEWRLALSRSDGSQVVQALNDGFARLALEPDGFVEVIHAERRTVLHTPEPVVPAALLHPYLGTTAIMFARWTRRLSFHAGCLVGPDGGVWAVLGDREAGKTSLLAWVLLHGGQIFADDLLVTDGATAFAGPRILDLRQEASERFGIGDYVGRLGSRERWRVKVGDVSPELPLRGFIQLGWSDRISLRSVPMPDRLRALARNRGLLVGEEAPDAWFQVVSLPLLRFERPRDWAQLDASTEQLLSAMG